MPTLDDDFLDAHGLKDLPAPARGPLLARLRFELEDVVGRRISEGLDAAQLAEFGAILDGDPRALAEFLGRHRPEWETDPTYQRLVRELGPDRPLIDRVVDYASGAWLELHRPDFRACVLDAVEDLGEQVRSRSDVILREARAATAVDPVAGR